MWGLHIRDRTSPLSREKKLLQGTWIAFRDPDFLLVAPMHEKLIEYKPTSSIAKDTYQTNTDHSLEHLKAVVIYFGDERITEVAISRPLMIEMLEEKARVHILPNN